MKMHGLVLGLVAACFAAGTVRGGESCYLVKTAGFDRKVEMQTMSESEYKAFSQTIKQEQKYFSKALAIVARDWRADELNKGIAFPGSRLVTRTIMGAQKFASQEKADEQLSKYQDQEAKKLEREAAHEKRNPQRNKNKSKSAQEMKEAELTRAADQVKAKLEELIAKAGGGASEGAPAAAADIRAGGAGLGVGVGGGAAGKPDRKIKADPKK